MTDVQSEAGVRGWPRVLLQLEGAALFGAALVGYVHVGGAWPLFALLFLAPDLGMLGYLAGPRFGAATYNLTHTETWPLVMAACGLAAAPALLPFALIWLAHVGFDRMLGYGLKHSTRFGATHLGSVGRRLAVA